MDSGVASLVVANVAFLMRKVPELEDRLERATRSEGELQELISKLKDDIQAMQEKEAFQEASRMQMTILDPEADPEAGVDKGNRALPWVNLIDMRLDAGSELGDRSFHGNFDETEMVEDETEMVDSVQIQESVIYEENRKVEAEMDLDDFRVMMRNKPCVKEEKPSPEDQRGLSPTVSQEQAKLSKKYMKAPRKRFSGGHAKVKLMPYRCQKCSEAFLLKRELTNHMKSHRSIRAEKEGESVNEKSKAGKCETATGTRPEKSLSRHPGLQKSIKGLVTKRVCNYPGCGKEFLPHEIIIHQIKTNHRQGG